MVAQNTKKKCSNNQIEGNNVTARESPLGCGEPPGMTSVGFPGNPPQIYSKALKDSIHTLAYMGKVVHSRITDINNNPNHTSASYTSIINHNRFTRLCRTEVRKDETPSLILKL